MKLTVIIPVFNEGANILPTLERLNEQLERNFDVVICDNASTDDSALVIRAFLLQRSLGWKLISEPRKGTGAAADTAARAAIADGATHIARTDADCLPALNWTQTIKRLFTDTELEFVAGVSPPRTDDRKIGRVRSTILTLTNELAIAFGQVRPSNRGPQFKGPYIMASGNNLAITARLYLEVGGFLRTAIEEAHEDRALIQAVRQVTARYAFCRHMVVHASARRLEAWGIVNSLRWYAGHKYLPAHVDIR